MIHSSVKRWEKFTGGADPGDVNAGAQSDIL